MKTIEIKTTQNVILEYELADLRDRAIAYIIDLAAIGVTMMILSWVLFTVIAQSESETAIVIVLIIVFSVFIFYSLVFETLTNGKSLGKMAMRIQVIKTVGGQATFADYAARWVFRMIDIYFSMGAVASVLVASSSRAQRIGDIVANTAVIKTVPQVDVRLKDILEMKSQDSYKPVYQQARNLDEEDLLLVKRALSRIHEYDNQAHRDAIRMLAAKIKQELNITTPTEADRMFLQTILTDYVVLTR